ncbi:MAG: hypothetical protein AABZ60_06060 [Planctomycetota bacterium]
MKIISVKKLALGMTPYPLFHTSGNLLLEAGERVTLQTIKCFIQAKIQEVFALEENDNIFHFIAQTKRKTLHIDELTPKHQLFFPLFLPNGTLLFGSTLFLSSEQCHIAKTLGIDYVIVQKTSDEMNGLAYQKFCELQTKQKTHKRKPSLFFSSL